jgi:hypothetical protein
MGEQHLDALAVTARLLEGLSLGERAGNIAGVLGRFRNSPYVVPAKNTNLLR